MSISTLSSSLSYQYLRVNAQNLATEIIHNEYPVLIGQPSNYFEHRKTALRWIQKLSGKVWTDYNAHDPGVTILEVLSYVLTEIEYKLDFPIDDLLASSDDAGPLKLEHNGFYLAEDIMTCAPVTLTDYRKLIINSVEEINNAWLIPKKEAPHVFEVLLLKKQVNIPDEDAINATSVILENNRAMGAPHMEIKIASFAYISLYVDIHIQSDADIEEVLAQIFYNLNESYLNVNPRRQTFSELEAQGLDYSEIFDGPKMNNGIVVKENLHDLFKTISATEIKKVIASTPGVVMISNLFILERYKPEAVLTETDLGIDYSTPSKVGWPKQEFDVPRGFLPFFSPKHTHIHNKIKIFKNDKEVEFSPTKVYEVIRHLSRKASRNYKLKNHHEVTYKRSAKKRKIDDYYSIKHDFPQAYGLNSKGFSFIQNFDPYSSKQLKDYLLPYEQILANTFKGLSNLWTMFSTVPVKGELFHIPLKIDGDQLVENNGMINTSSIKKVVRNRMQFFKRRDRMLTHLLARFDVHLLDEFEIQIAQNEFEYFNHVIKRKEKLLQKADTLIYNRGVFNNKSYEGITSLEEELYLYLGISDPPEKPYYKATSDLVKIIKKTESDYDIKANTPLKDPPSENNFDRYQKGHFKKRSKIISELLMLGINKSSYTLLPSENGEKFHITLNNSDESFSLSIGKKKTYESALHDILLFVKKFTEISKNSEGFYMIDHIMLELQDEDKEFTDFRMSFLFPKWTARFQNESYQKEVERIVLKLIPAHICCECYWLDLEEMKRFEKVYYKVFSKGIYSEKFVLNKDKNTLIGILKKLSAKKN